MNTEPISMPVCRLTDPNGKHVLTFHLGATEDHLTALTRHLLNDCVEDGFYNVLHAVINTTTARPSGEMYWRKRSGQLEINSGRVQYA